MSIYGQNALLNQYSPVFLIKNLFDGQILVYDSSRKAFVNADAGTAGGGATRLGQLLDVSPNVDNPLSVQNGQALVYNSFTGLWENSFVDYNTLLNKPGPTPTSFIGLTDTAKPSLPNGYVKWDPSGLQLIYSTTIPASSITGLATVAITGNYNDLTNKPVTGGTVTTVSVVTANGVSGTVANPTTTPAITMVLGAITPTSVAATGTVTGSNLSGTNTGDQSAPVSQVVYGSGSGLTSSNTLTYVPLTGVLTVGGPAAGHISSEPGQTLQIASDISITLTTNSINRLVINQNGSFSIAGSTGTVGQVLTSTGPTTSPTWQTIISGGTVSSVSGSGTQGVTVSVLTPTTTPAITVGLGNITPTSVAATGTVTGSNLSGTNTGDQTITLTGDVTGSGTGTFPATLATVNATPGTYGDSDNIAVVTVNNKGLVTSVTTTPVDTTVSDLLPADGVTTETYTIQPRHQYIVTGRLEIVGHVINNGRIAVL